MPLLSVPDVFLIVLFVAAVVGIGFYARRARSGPPAPDAPPAVDVPTGAGTRPAEIVKARTGVYGGGYVRNPPPQHYRTFEFADGETIELLVPPALEGSLLVGDAGTLTWKGPKFVAFEKAPAGSAAPGSDPSEPPEPAPDSQ
jgi:hypothetical protein